MNKRKLANCDKCFFIDSYTTDGEEYCSPDKCPYTPTTENKGGVTVKDVCDAHGVEYRPASPTKADKVESLAELADRKGMYIILAKNCAYPVGWLIHLQYRIAPHDKFSMYEIPGKDDNNVYTYTEAESLARAFLTGLDDVTGKGGR